jgi:N-dimethylarginine dimethylaminohydrolase
MAPKTVGSNLPSTFGGRGWVTRVGSHADDVKQGALWTRCGYRSECAPLRAVMLARPPDSFAAIDTAEDHLMMQSVDLGAMRAQTDEIAQVYRRNGVKVYFVDPPATCPPNVVFQRDLFLMTPEGAVLARMASAQRAGEERYTAQALASAGFPILQTVTGTATFEGADALWVDERTVALGVGFRTNSAGAEVVRQALRHQGAEVVKVPLAQGVQHLLGTVVFLDERLAAVHSPAMHRQLRRLLEERDYHLVEFDADKDFLQHRAMNLVALGPRQVLMPTGAPNIRRKLESVGVHTQEVCVAEHVKAGGGLGCVTGVLLRSASVNYVPRTPRHPHHARHPTT